MDLEMAWVSKNGQTARCMKVSGSLEKLMGTENYIMQTVIYTRETG